MSKSFSKYSEILDYVKNELSNRSLEESSSLVTDAQEIISVLRADEGEVFIFKPNFIGLTVYGEELLQLYLDRWTNYLRLERLHTKTVEELKWRKAFDAELIVKNSEDHLIEYIEVYKDLKETYTSDPEELSRVIREVIYQKEFRNLMNLFNLPGVSPFDITFYVHILKPNEGDAAFKEFLVEFSNSFAYVEPKSLLFTQFNNLTYTLMLPKLLEEFGTVKALSLLKEGLEAGVTVEQWESFLENHKKYTDMPASWWKELVG